MGDICYLPDCVIDVSSTQAGGLGPFVPGFTPPVAIPGGGMPVAAPPSAFYPTPRPGPAVPRPRIAPAPAPKPQPVPAATPTLPEVVVSAPAISSSVPTMSVVAPFFIGELTPGLRAGLQTGEEILSQLLEQPVKSLGGALTEFEQLLERPLSELDRLLAKPMVSTFENIAKVGPATAEEIATGALRSFAGALTPLQMLLYSPDLGPSAAEEAQNVISQLVPAQPGGQPPGLPDVVPATAGGDIPAPPLPPVTVTASRISDFVPPGELPSSPNFQVQPGSFTVPRTQPTPQSQTGRATQPAVRPGAVQQTLPNPGLATLPLLATLPGGLTGLTPSTGPTAAPGSLAAIDPSTQTATQTEKCGPQKKQKKKRKPREKCHRGTYVETSKSTIKHPKEIIKCQ